MFVACTMRDCKSTRTRSDAPAVSQQATPVLALVHSYISTKKGKYDLYRLQLVFGAAGGFVFLLGLGMISQLFTEARTVTVISLLSYFDAVVLGAMVVFVSGPCVGVVSALLMLLLLTPFTASGHSNWSAYSQGDDAGGEPLVGTEAPPRHVHPLPQENAVTSGKERAACRQ